MKLALLGPGGKVGSVLGPALEAAGHQVKGIERGDPLELAGLEATIDFTRPDAVFANARSSLLQEVPVIVGTSGLGGGQLKELDSLARTHSLVCLVVPNFALGAMLMMRFAERASQFFPKAEIIELHHETKLDAPSGTAKATAERLDAGAPIHSVRLPGLLAHQEVLFGDAGQLLTIRHDTLSREAFVPGVLLALERLPTLAPGLTVGLDSLLD